MESQDQLRVLIAEDNELNRKVLIAFLRNLGYEPDVATDGLEVLDLVGASTYDLILMDMRMPNMDGVEATMSVRRLGEAISQPRIVGVSASALPSDGPTLSDAGIDGFLSKPLRLRELEAMIDSVMKTA